MRRGTNGTGRGRWPGGVLGALALICLVESAVARHRLAFLDFTSVTWGLSRRAAEREATEARVLCFGDSLLKYGIYPELIARGTGKTVFNLAVNAGRAPGSYFLLRRALAAGARPSAVLIDFEPNILAQTPLTNPELWAELVSVRDCVELAGEGRDGCFLARTLLAKLLPSLRYRFPIRDTIVRNLGGRVADPGDDALTVLREADRNLGGLAVPHRQRDPVAIVPPHPIFFPVGWHCDKLNRRYVRRFLELAEAYEVPVFWVVPPFTPSIQTDRERLGQDAAFTRFANAARKGLRNVTLGDARRASYDPSVFWDGTVHLDVKGASALSGDVAEVLMRSFAGEAVTGWVELPAYRDLGRVARSPSVSPAR